MKSKNLSKATPEFDKTKNQPLLTGFYMILWSRRESNSYLLFRKQLFYPLNYGTKRAANLLLKAHFYNQHFRIFYQLRNKTYTKFVNVGYMALISPILSP